MKKLIWLALLMPMLANAAAEKHTQAELDEGQAAWDEAARIRDPTYIVPIHGPIFCKELRADMTEFAIEIKATPPELELMSVIEDQCGINFNRLLFGYFSTEAERIKKEIRSMKIYRLKGFCDAMVKMKNFQSTEKLPNSEAFIWAFLKNEAASFGKTPVEYMRMCNDIITTYVSILNVWKSPITPKHK